MLQRIFAWKDRLRTTPARLPGERWLGDGPGLPPHAGTASAIYEGSPWVYVAVNRIAEAAALVPLHVYRLEGEQRVAVERHPLERLLDAPNPRMSRFELIEATVGLLELCGNAYWFLSGDAQGQPAEIHPLRPDRVRIVPDETGGLRGYIYEVDGKRLPLAPAEVVHFKRWHPGSDYLGLSTLAAARSAIEADRAMARWNAQTFSRDQGIPAGIVNIKDHVSDSDFERIQREWRSSYGSGQRRTAFLRGGTVNWQHIGLHHTDLDFLRGRRANREEILNLFGIPLGLLSENATEANARVAERHFIERTLWPKLVRIAQKVTQELLPFYPGAHVAEFEDIRPTDAQARLHELRAARGILSINELRARYFALGPVAWGDAPEVAAPDPASIPAAPASHAVTAQSPASKGALEELDAWERFALRRLGRASSRAFSVQHLPQALALEAQARLLALEDRAGLKALFSELRERLQEEEEVDDDLTLNPSPEERDLNLSLKIASGERDLKEPTMDAAIPPERPCPG